VENSPSTTQNYSTKSGTLENLFKYKKFPGRKWRFGKCSLPKLN